MDPLDCRAELIAWEQDSALATWFLVLMLVIVILIEMPRVLEAARGATRAAVRWWRRRRPELWREYLVGNRFERHPVPRERNPW